MVDHAQGTTYLAGKFLLLETYFEFGKFPSVKIMPGMGFLNPIFSISIGTDCGSQTEITNFLGNQPEAALFIYSNRGVFEIARADGPHSPCCV